MNGPRDLSFWLITIRNEIKNHIVTPAGKGPIKGPFAIGTAGVQFTGT
jgi:hypothetical protein